MRQRGEDTGESEGVYGEGDGQNRERRATQVTDRYVEEMWVEELERLKSVTVAANVAKATGVCVCVCV